MVVHYPKMNLIHNCHPLACVLTPTSIFQNCIFIGCPPPFRDLMVTRGQCSPYHPPPHSTNLPNSARHCRQVSVLSTVLPRLCGEVRGQKNPVSWEDVKGGRKESTKGQYYHSCPNTRATNVPLGTKWGEGEIAPRGDGWCNCLSAQRHGLRYIRPCN